LVIAMSSPSTTTRFSVRELCCALTLLLVACGNSAPLGTNAPDASSMNTQTAGNGGGGTGGGGAAQTAGTNGGGTGGGGGAAQTAGTGGGTAVAGTVGSNSDAGAAPAACAAPMGARVYIDAPDAIMAALPGHWVRCGHALTSDESEVGLEIAADFRYHLLVRAPDGSEAPSTSLFAVGHVMVNPLGTFDGHLSFNLDFISDANVDTQTRPFFTNGMPLQLVTTNTDIFWLRYVRVDP
jgi:hypothetical protein